MIRQYNEDGTPNKLSLERRIREIRKEIEELETKYEKISDNSRLSKKYIEQLDELYAQKSKLGKLYNKHYGFKSLSKKDQLACKINWLEEKNYHEGGLRTCLEERYQRLVKEYNETYPEDEGSIWAPYEYDFIIPPTFFYAHEPSPQHSSPPKALLDYIYYKHHPTTQTSTSSQPPSLITQ